MTRLINRTQRPFLIVIALVIFIPLLMYPFAVMVSTALKSNQDINTVTFLPSGLAWSNFVNLWSQVGLGQYLVNSVIISGASGVVATLVAIMAGYSVSRYRYPGRSAFIALMLATQMFSPVVFLLPLFHTFSAFGLLDTRLGLIIVNIGFNMPFAVWLMSRYLATVPKDLEEAAYVDGATEFGAMVRVVAPLAAPGIVVAFIFSFMSAWNEFTFALTFMTTQQKMPVTLGLYQYVGHFGIQWNYLMGACLLAVIPPVVLFIAVQRYMISGLTTGSLSNA